MSPFGPLELARLPPLNRLKKFTKNFAIGSKKKSPLKSPKKFEFSMAAQSMAKIVKVQIYCGPKNQAKIFF